MTELARVVLRDAREQAVKEIQKRVRPGHTEPVGATIVSVTPSTPTVLARLDGATTPVPVRSPVLPRALRPGDRVVVDSGKGGWLIIDKILGLQSSQAGRPLILDARDWGVRADGRTDDTSNIRRAIAEAAGIGPLVLPGMCLITSPIRISVDQTKLWGLAGMGGFHNLYATTAKDPSARSGFIWGGPEYTAGDMDAYTILVIEPPAAADAPRLLGIEVTGLAFRGGSRAARAIAYRSGMDGRFEVFYDHTVGPGFEMGAVADADLGEFTDPQSNIVSLSFDQTGDGDGEGVLLDWQPNASNANTSMNRFPTISGHYRESDAVVFGATDNNLVELLRVLQQGAGPYGYGLRLKASASAGGHARSNVFLEVAAGAGGMLSEGTASGANPAVRNVILSYDKQSGSVPDPTIEAGSTLWWTGNDDAGTHQTREGIRFPATQKPSTDANTLDDYEEGTWTPDVTFATPGTFARTISIATGRYTKVGRTVTLSGRVQTSAFTVGTASGLFKITGNPFTPATLASHRWESSASVRGYTKANFTQVNASIASADSTVYLHAAGSGQTDAFLAVADMSAAGGVVDISFTVTFEV